MRKSPDAFTAECEDRYKILTRVAVFHGERRAISVAKWDTGATQTCISPQLAESIGAERTGTFTVGTSGGISETDGYRVTVMLPNGMTIPDVNVLGGDIHALGFDMLIGMDILTLGDFAMGCKDGVTRFSFRIPSQTDPDFTDE